MTLTGENRRTRRKTCPSAILSTTNPTWIVPGARPGLRGERPATNDLIHCTASYIAQISEHFIPGDGRYRHAFLLCSYEHNKLALVSVQGKQRDFSDFSVSSAVTQSSSPQPRLRTTNFFFTFLTKTVSSVKILHAFRVTICLVSILIYSSLMYIFISVSLSCPLYS
jgi:hypothetical protein